MIMKTIANPSNSPIVDYPISEAQVDAAGNIMYDKDGKMMLTTRTLTWSIAPGETVKLPDYVANYLLTICDFLVDKGEEAVKAETSSVAEDGKITCKLCGKTFKEIKGYALHMAFRHKEELLK